MSPDGLVVVRGGEAVGPLFGGTITQLAASLGTPYAFDPPAGCVLFLEDVNERPYRLDRHADAASACRHSRPRQSTRVRRDAGMR